MNKKLIIWLGILVLILLWSLVSIYPDWLWFENLGFSSIFWTMLLSKFGLGLTVWLVFILTIILNLYLAHRLSLGTRPERVFREETDYYSSLPLSAKALNSLLLAFILIVSFIVASRGSSRWDMVLRYLYQQPFGSPDPIFNRDIGFYVFSLPFYLFVQSWFLGFFIFAGLLIIWWYLKEGALQISSDFTLLEGQPRPLPKISFFAERAKKHLILLGGIIVLLLAWGYRLKMFKLLYSTQGPAFGASYTDVNIQLLAYKVLIIVSLAWALILFFNLFRPRTKLIWLGGGIWVGAILLFTTIIPALTQKFVVEPNELAKETPYITYNIDYTRRAYGLDRVKESNFAASDQLSMEDIKKNDLTIQNIRIWDERPLLQTYKQIQAIRLYYDFTDVDVDRYLVNGQYRQVMLAARELVVNQLPLQANTWVNRHLIYTHGYGLALSPVNEVTSEGLPRLFIKDVPPSSEIDLKVERPEIYYGEKTDQYVIVRTKTQEFDYPKGDQNVYTTYQGKGGIPLNTFARRVLFALEFWSPQILFTGYLSPESRIMYNRRIDQRVRLIAPFLDYDQDPYLVISQGKLFWIQDAYTTSNMYPYSRRSKSYRQFKDEELNYIRNSVKVIIDAYTGDVSFYLVDEEDPIAKTYLNLFPGLFKPFKEMPAGLKEHLRYPKDFFEIQANMYRTYHMQEAAVFYNQEDLWQIPNELYGGNRQDMEGYYAIIKLPEENKEEFLLMLPFTPSKKDNMIGWLAARSDLSHYGNLVVYKLPKDKLVFGPMQIEARVDQQTEISRELTLWGQMGSRVIRGNLLAIPVNNSFIYVEPVYLEARQEEKGLPSAEPSPPSLFGRPARRQTPFSPEAVKSTTAAIPELKRIIVAFGDRLIMEESLYKGIGSIFGRTITPKEPILLPSSLTGDVYKLAESALGYYNKAKDYLRQGNWSEYGRELENLEKTLKEMSRVNKGKQ